MCDTIVVVGPDGTIELAIESIGELMDATGMALADLRFNSGYAAIRAGVVRLNCCLCPVNIEETLERLGREVVYYPDWNTYTIEGGL